MITNLHADPAAAVGTYESRKAKRVLDPSERTAEVLFGLIMVLTFTGSLSMAEAGRADIREMLIGALGCNIAWGVIDGVLYLMGALAERSRNLTVHRAVREARGSAAAHAVITDALPEVVASVLQTSDLEMLRQRLHGLPSPSEQTKLTRNDWLGAIGVFLLVFSSTFPVALPFMLMQDAPTALRVSNGIAVAMLFAVGVAYGRSVHRSHWLIGLGMVVLGIILVGLTIALGG